MNLTRPVAIVLASVAAASVASSAEAVRTTRSVSDLSIFVTLQRYRIYADRCSTKSPQLKPEFDSLMQDLDDRIRAIANGLLSTTAFKGMNGKSVPDQIGFAFADSLDDAKHNVARQESESFCRKSLKEFAEIDDGSLKADLTQILIAVQKMTRNLETESARQVSPDNLVQRSGSP